ncbi:MAG: DNA/RNA nuclease SfsA [Desulfurococcaceae archaeon]
MYSLTPLLRVNELFECMIVRRLSRFTLLAEIEGCREIVYVNNTGRLRDFLVHGKKGYCIENMRGRLRYRVIGIEDHGYAALIDTNLQEKSFLLAQKAGLLPWLISCTLYRRNYRVGDAVIDFAFKCNGDTPVLVELKSAVMRLCGNIAGYPDAPTQRGRYQLLELTKYAKQGGHAIVVFIVGIPMASLFKLHCREDARIADVARIALRSGVLFKAVNIFLDPINQVIVMDNPDMSLDMSCTDTCT